MYEHFTILVATSSPASSFSHHVPVSSLISSPPVTSVQLTLNGGLAIIRNTELLSPYACTLETKFFCAESLSPFPSHTDDFPETENGPRPDTPGMVPASRGDPRYFAERREGLLSSARLLMGSIEVCGLIGSETLGGKMRSFRTRRFDNNTKLLVSLCTIGAFFFVLLFFFFYFS